MTYAVKSDASTLASSLTDYDDSYFQSLSSISASDSESWDQYTLPSYEKKFIFRAIANLYVRSLGESLELLNKQCLDCYIKSKVDHFIF